MELLYGIASIVGIISGLLIIIERLFKLFKRLPKKPGLVTVQVIEDSIVWEVEFKLPFWFFKSPTKKK